ncbi:MAG: flagellin [Candidatus Abyssobacteria bacterium SURF_17]|uniref:Flagellin n=1 Tax=Candidatus Abyssobacteria bacterium SURF_17 TaxID=2093361 RepID=A0A419F436_9BACT|nr:MAG: flagellin [Candidatus Abyssubacteria bacterium SURF_17]
MGLRIDTTGTFASQRFLLLQQAQLQRQLGELSSGLRINSAADDPAGLGISEQLRARIGGVNALATNASRARNLVQTAEGALTEVNAQLATIRGLAVQAGNGAVLGEAGLQAIQDQITLATQSINRVVETTQFAGRPLLNGTFQDEQFAIGEGNPARLTIANLAPSELGRGVENESGFANLAEIDVTTPQGAADALRVVDAAINEVSSVRGELGAFQTNVLESSFRQLQINRENLMASDSTIRDTDIARAAGEAALSQIRLQASIFAQNAANRRTGMLVDLLA